jgi:hypothetical protein
MRMGPEFHAIDTSARGLRQSTPAFCTHADLGAANVVRSAAPVDSPRGGDETD